MSMSDRSKVTRPIPVPDEWTKPFWDGFSASVIHGLESYGFCGEGEALDFIQDGRMELDGELPPNTFGGSLGTGRIHGLWHIIEGAPGQGRQRVLRRRPFLGQMCGAERHRSASSARRRSRPHRRPQDRETGPAHALALRLDSGVTDALAARQVGIDGR